MSGAEAIFGTVAGGAGLLSLSIQLCESAVKLNRILQSAKDAPKRISRLVFGLETIAIALRELEHQRQKSGYHGVVLIRCLAQCQESVAEIEELINKIEIKLGKNAKICGRLYTVFKEPELKELLDKLDKARSSLELAYMIYLGEEQRRFHEAQTQTLVEHNIMLRDLKDHITARGKDISQQLVLVSEHSKVQYHIAKRAESSFQGTIGPKFRGGQPDVSSQVTKRKNHGTVFRARIYLPTFISRAVWDLGISHSQCGWTMHLHTYNIISDQSPIFRYCRRGDLCKLRKELSNGKASLFDIGVDAHNNSWTLLEVAVVAGKQDVCQYLLNQTTWPDFSRMVTRSIGNIWGFNKCNDKTKAEMLRFLIGRPELDIHAEPSVRSFWALICSGGKLLYDVLENQYPGFETSPVESRFELASRLLNLSIGDFMNCVGLRPWDRRLAVLKTRNRLSTLDYVAQKLVSFCWGILPKSELVEWMNLGVSVLKNGADPCSLADDDDIDWFKNGYDPTTTQMTESGPGNPNRRNTTPLLKLLMSHWAVIDCRRKWLEISLRCLRIWVGMIRDAGIDLLDYGNREKRMWDYHGAQNNGRHNCMELTDLIVGQTPALWSLKTRCREYRPTYTLQQIPGSYPAERRLPHIITWPPTKKEKSEGFWAVATHRIFFSEEMDIQDLLASQPAMFTHLVDEAQDDSGLVMIMQYRAARMHNTRSRSCSQPPSSQRRELDLYSIHTSDRRPWLPGYHFCPFDLRWQLSCCSPIAFKSIGKVFTGYVYPAEFQLRDCITGNGRFCPSVQQSEEWTRYSFLGEIVRCQDSHGYAPNECPNKKDGQKSSLGYPEGCANIHIDQLVVPKALQRFHPTRWRKYTYDEVDESDADI